MGGDERLHDQRRDLVTVGQHNDIVTPSLEGPEIWFRGMLYVKVLQVDGFLLRKCLEDSLKQAPVVVAMYPVLEGAGLYLSEFESGVRMKGEPVPILSFDHQVANEKPFGRASKVEYPNNFVDL